MCTKPVDSQRVFGETKGEEGQGQQEGATGQGGALGSGNLDPRWENGRMHALRKDVWMAETEASLSTLWTMRLRCLFREGECSITRFVLC